MIGKIEMTSTIHTHAHYIALDTPSFGGCPRVGLHRLNIKRVLIVELAPIQCVKFIRGIDSTFTQEGTSVRLAMIDDD